MEVLSILKLGKTHKTGSQHEVSLTIAKDMEWCVESKYMQRWGAKRAKKPTKHREPEETQTLEIFGSDVD